MRQTRLFLPCWILVAVAVPVVLLEPSSQVLVVNAQDAATLDPRSSEEEDGGDTSNDDDGSTTKNDNVKKTRVFIDESKVKTSLVATLESLKRVQSSFQALKKTEIKLEKSVEEISVMRKKFLEQAQETATVLKTVVNVQMIRNLQDELSQIHEREIAVRSEAEKMIGQMEHNFTVVFGTNNETNDEDDDEEEEDEVDTTPRIKSDDELDHLLRPEAIFERHDACMEQICARIFMEAARQAPFPHVDAAMLDDFRQENGTLDQQCASPEQAAQIIQSALVQTLQSYSPIVWDDEESEFYDHAQHAGWIVHEYTSPTFLAHDKYNAHVDTDSSSAEDARTMDEDPWWMHYVPEDWIDAVAYYMQHNGHPNETAAKKVLARWGNLFASLIPSKATLYQRTNPPESILHPLILPGACWPIQGSQGHVTIALPYSLYVTSISLDHASRLLLEEHGGSNDDDDEHEHEDNDDYEEGDGEDGFEEDDKEVGHAKRSAPKRVRIVGYPPCATSSCPGGLTFDVLRPVELLQFKYDLESRETMQTFVVPYLEDGESQNDGDDDDDNELDIPPGSCTAPLLPPEDNQEPPSCGGDGPGTLTRITTDARFAAFRIEVLENYGNPNFTCLYRVRIHGKRQKEKGISDRHHWRP